jgi:cobalt-zinc-cadmium efflux system outer membrane protein
VGSTLLSLLLCAGEPGILSEPELPSPLSLAQAEEIFVAHGLDLLIAEAAVEGAAGDREAAGALPNPIGSGGVLYSFPITTHVGSTATDYPHSWGWTVGLSDNALLETLLSGKYALRVEGAARALAAAKLSREDLIRIELSQLRQAYLAVLLAEKNVSLAGEVKESFDKTRKLNQIRFDKGDISQVDLSRIVVGELESEQALALARNAQRQAVSTLGFLLGVRGRMAQFEVSGTLAYRTLPELAQTAPESLLALAQAHRPDVQAASATREQKEALLSQAKRQRIPDINVQATFTSQWEDTNVITPPTLQVGLSSPLPIFYQQQGEVRRARADLSVAQRQEARARAQVVLDVTQAYFSYRSATDLVERMEGQLLAQAKLARDLAQLMYHKGAASLLDFLDAQRTYIATNLEYHQDLVAYWTAVYQLEAATAVPLR